MATEFGYGVVDTNILAAYSMRCNFKLLEAVDILVICLNNAFLRKHPRGMPSATLPREFALTSGNPLTIIYEIFNRRNFKY